MGEGQVSCISFKGPCKFLCRSYLADWSVGLWRRTTMPASGGYFSTVLTMVLLRYRQSIHVECHDECWQLPYLGLHQVDRWKTKAGQVWCSDMVDEPLIFRLWSWIHYVMSCRGVMYQETLSQPRTNAMEALEGETLGEAEQVPLG